MMNEKTSSSSSSEEMRAKLKAFKFDDCASSHNSSNSPSWSSRPVRPRPSLNVVSSGSTTSTTTSTASTTYGPSITRSRPAPGPLTFSTSTTTPSPGETLRFASSVMEQEKKMSEIMSQTGLIQINGKKVKAIIDDFELLGDLGNGTCGHVVKMRHRQSGQVIAVKQMRRTSNGEENKRIIMDLDVVLKSYDCKEIVLCLGFFITDSDVWICMELMATCFDKLLKQLKQPIPEDICGKVAVATVKALNYLKERHGVIHRDVKPSNILLEPSGRVKLCDFGISGRLVDSKAKTRSAGCAAYMAPERIDPPNPSKPDYDIRADVWSLGITLVELATGYFPYRDCKTDFEVLTKVLQDDPPLLPRNGGFSLEFRSFVKDCLMKNYKDRPKYKKLLNHPFIVKYERADVDVGAWYRSKTEALDGSINTNSSSSSSNSSNLVDSAVSFKPQPSPRVVRSSRRPPQSPPGGYPSAISRFNAVSVVTTSPPSSTAMSAASTTTASFRSIGSPTLNSRYDHRRYPNGTSYSSSSTAATPSMFNSPSRSPAYHSGPTSLPETLSSRYYRGEPSLSKKFDFTFPTMLYNNHDDKQHRSRADNYVQHYLPTASATSTSTTTDEPSSRLHLSGRVRDDEDDSHYHHQHPTSSPSQQQQQHHHHHRSPSSDRSNGGRNFFSTSSWRNMWQSSPISLRRLRTSSTDRSSTFDTARRFQPSYRSWNNEKDNYFNSMKR